MHAFKLGPVQKCLRFHDFPGDKTPLLFVHGLGCASSCDYPRVAQDPVLAGRRKVLVDLLGSGFSDRPRDFGYTVEDHATSLIALIDSLALDAFDLFGHSAGGAVAIALATLCRKQVRHLVLSEPNLDPGGGTYSRAMADQSEHDYVASGHAASVRQAEAEGNFIWQGSLAVASPFALHRWAVSLVAGSNPTWREQLTALTMPRTVIFGAQSLPDPETERLPKAGVPIQIVPDAGHSMAWENPAGLAAAIRAALED